MTLILTSFSITTFSIKRLFATLSITTICYIVFILSVYTECHVFCSCAECCYAECRYAECRYAECCYAECRYAECRGPECICNTG